MSASNLMRYAIERFNDSETQESPGATRKGKAGGASVAEENVPGVARKRPSPVSTNSIEYKTRKIIRLLKSEDRLVPLRFIKSTMRANGINYRATSRALKRIRNKDSGEFPEVIHKKLPSSYGRVFPPHAYIIHREPRADEWKCLDRLHQLLRKVCDDHSSRHGNIGQDYYRQVLGKTRLFKPVPRKMLGHFRAPDPEKPGSYLELDMIAVHKASGRKLGFTIRNHNGPVYSRDKHIKELPKYKRAFPELHQLVIVTSYIDPPCCKYLDKLGFPWVDLGVQLLPKKQSYLDGRHTKTVLKELHPLTGPEERMLVTCDESGRKVRFPRSGKYDDLVKLHLARTIAAVEKALR